MNPLDQIKLIISEEMDVDPEEINEDTSLRDDLNMDQISILQVMMALEVDFGIELDPSDISQIRTVGDALSYVSDEF